jgi:hypothetical protein
MRACWLIFSHSVSGVHGTASGRSIAGVHRDWLQPGLSLLASAVVPTYWHFSLFLLVLTAVLCHIMVPLWSYYDHKHGYKYSPKNEYEKCKNR